jgi:phosphoribosylglycinamide formyltransferase-1
MNARKIGVLVSGRGSNLQVLLDAIAAGTLPLHIAVVISDNADAPALQRARTANIPALVVSRADFSSKEGFEDQLTEHLEQAGVQLVVLAGFMRLLSSHFINKWRQRVINIHPALLPSFPGLHAQAQALAYGVKLAGCTVHFVDEGTDTGPIIMQKQVPVYPEDTEETLSARILAQEHLALPEALRLWSADKLAITGRIVKILS